MILLTDEEIRQELAKVPETNLYLPSAYEETSIEWNEFVAKAQLKKVVDAIRERQAYTGVVTPGNAEIPFMLPNKWEELWQALLEEVKD